MSPLLYWVWLSMKGAIRPGTKMRLLERFQSAGEIFFAQEPDFSGIDLISEMEIKQLMDKETAHADRIIDVCQAACADLLTIQDAAYPARLRSIYNPPLVLYVRGKLPFMDGEAAIAIAGTRRATPYGIKMARRVGYEITKGGGLVVSGLAAGIDSAGAQGALRAGGRCVGVLGTAIDEVYPKSNGPLFEDVQTVGALVSEYPPGHPIRSGNFPARNRIISGLALGVTIIEAPRKSGALITANIALEQGRDVYVVPGNADSANSEGSLELIKEGAQAVTSGRDILSQYAGQFPERLRPVDEKLAKIPQEEDPADTPFDPARQADEPRGFYKYRERASKKVIDTEEDKEYIDLEQQLEALSETQLKLIAVIDRPMMHVDDIIDLSGIPVEIVLSELTLLEIQGMVVQERGKRFSLNIKTKQT